MAAFWILLASFLFSLMGAGVKVASQLSYTLSEIVMYRGLIGAVLIYASMRHQGGSLATANPGAHVWRSSVGLLSMWLSFVAIARLPLATAVTVSSMSPVWTAVFLVLLAWWHGKRGVAPAMLLAVGVSFAGVVLALQPVFETRQWLGAVMGLGSGMMAAVAYMLIRRLSRLGEPEYRVVFYFSLINMLAGMAGLAVEGVSPFHAHSWTGAAVLLGIGLAGTLAQFALTRAYRTGKTLVVANLQYTGIVFSSCWGILWWGDVFDTHVWLGMAMILGSSITATYYNSRATT